MATDPRVNQVQNQGVQTRGSSGMRSDRSLGAGPSSVDLSPALPSSITHPDDAQATVLPLRTVRIRADR